MCSRVCAIKKKKKDLYLISEHLPAFTWLLASLLLSSPPHDWRHWELSGPSHCKKKNTLSNPFTQWSIIYYILSGVFFCLVFFYYYLVFSNCLRKCNFSNLNSLYCLSNKPVSKGNMQEIFENYGRLYSWHGGVNASFSTSIDYSDRDHLLSPNYLFALTNAYYRINLTTIIHGRDWWHEDCSLPHSPLIKHIWCDALVAFWKWKYKWCRPGARTT